MSDSPKKKKLPLWAKVILWIAGLGLAYTVAGFLILPAMIKSQLLKRLPPIAKRNAALRAVDFNPFTLALDVRGLALTETNGEAFAGFDGFHLQFQALSSLSRRAWVFKDVSLTGPYARVIRRKDGTFNFGNLLETTPPAAPAAAPAPAPALPAVIVESLRVDGASLEADDASAAAPFHDKLGPIHLQATGLATASNAAAPYVFSAVSDWGERFSASGKITLQPLQSSGAVKVTGLDLKKYAPYLAGLTRAELIGGSLDAGADYQFAAGPKGPDASVTKGTAQLTDLRVKSPDTGETVVSIPSLAVDLAEASLANRAVRIDSVKSSGGSLLVRQNQDGTLNLPALLKLPPSSATNPPPSSSSSSAARWTAQVDEITFDTYGVAFEDRQGPQPVKLNVSALAFTIKGFNSAGAAPVSIVMSMRLNEQGSLSAGGTVALAPISADIHLELADLDLPPFQPYLRDTVRLAISKGQLSVHGRAICALGSDGPAGSFAGDILLAHFATVELEHDTDLVKFDALAVKGVRAAFPRAKLQIEEVALTNLNATLALATNRQWNVVSVIPPAKSAAREAARPPAAAPGMPIDIGTVLLDKAAFHFVDRSLEPHCVFDLQELSGSVKGLSTQRQAPATVDLRGGADPFSPFAISGTVEPLAKDLSLDIVVSFKNLQLAAFTPYMEKYGGYPLEKGQLLLQLHYAIAGRKLAATNKIVIGGLTLGGRNNSPDATHLPVKLGVALLKDRQGNIALDVPLSGSLDDPKFRIGPLIMHEVRTLLAKAATAPFSLLASVFGGGAPPPSSVDFAPGEAILAPSEKTGIQMLAKALYERPALTLQIAGACDPQADSAVLARRNLERRIAKLGADELAAAGQPVPGVESIKLEPAGHARLLQKLYEQTFGADQLAPAPSNKPSLLAGPPGRTPKLVYVAPGSEAGIWRSHEVVKGGELLMRHKVVVSPVVATVPPAAPAPAAPSQPRPAAPTPSAPDLAQMEQRLLAEIRVTDDQLLDLMRARAQAAKSALLESGQIAPGRLFVLAPRPLHRGAKGEARVSFSLE